MHRRIIALLLIALCACEMPSARAVDHNREVIRMGNKGPFTQRSDGIGLDLDNNGPGLVVNGVHDSMFNTSLYVAVEEDFLGFNSIIDVDVTNTEGRQTPWVVQETSAVGAPTFARSADFDNGAIDLVLEATSEVQDLTLYWGDEQNIDSDTEPFCIFRLTYATAPTAAATLSWGLMSVRDPLQEAIANFACFSVTGADNNLDVQSDDATTDVADTDTTVDMVAGTFIETMVSLNSMHGQTDDDLNGASATDVHFFTRTTTGGAWTQRNTTTAFSLGADIALQPFVQVEKTAGTAVPDLRVDYIRCYWQRE